jgi:hypothetical protein
MDVFSGNHIFLYSLLKIKMHPKAGVFIAAWHLIL